MRCKGGKDLPSILRECIWTWMLLLECFGDSAMQDREGDDRAFEKGNGTDFYSDPVTSQLLTCSASFISSW